MSDKSYATYLAFIESVKKGQKSVIISKEYIVLSISAYNAIIDYHQPELKSVSFDEPTMNDWIKKRFLDDTKSEK